MDPTYAVPTASPPFFTLCPPNKLHLDTQWIVIGVIYYICGVARFWFRCESIWKTWNGDFSVFQQASSGLRSSQITKMAVFGLLFMLTWPAEIFLSVIIYYLVGAVQAYFPKATETTTPIRGKTPPPPYAADSREITVVE